MQVLYGESPLLIPKNTLIIKLHSCTAPQRELLKNQIRNIVHSEGLTIQDLEEVLADTQDGLALLELFLWVISCIAFCIGMFLLVISTS